MQNQSTTKTALYSICEVRDGFPLESILRSSQLQQRLKAAAEKNTPVIELTEIEFTTPNKLIAEAFNITSTAKSLLGVYEKLEEPKANEKEFEEFQENYFVAYDILENIKKICDKCLDALDNNNKIVEFHQDEQNMKGIN